MAMMDIPYILDNRTEMADLQFRSLWKVRADETYHAIKPQGFECPGLFMTCEGTGICIVDGQRHVLSANSYFIVPEGVPCSYRCEDDDDWQFYFIHFDPFGLVDELELPVVAPTATGRMAEAARLCERMIDEMIVQPRGYAVAMRLRAQELLLLLARERDEASKSRHPELDDILYWMHQHLSQPLAVEALVHRSGLSRSVFFARFRARTGLSPSQYMQRLKLDSARASLETTSQSVKQIAASLQFYDEFHFSKLFKQRYGLSPRAYRERLREGERRK